MLPALFKLRGAPMSLKDHIQFHAMYSDEYAQDTIFCCGRQVGKSLNLSRIEVLDAISAPELQLLYVAPLQSQSFRYSTLYLNEAIKSCELASIMQMKALEGKWSDSKILKAIGHQSFANGSGIQLTYAKTSPDRARGIFADVIDFDEVQDQLTDNIPIISQSTKSSKWGIRRFTGTAKTEDNTIEGLWRGSSMCEWAMKCPHCPAWNIPNLDGHVLDMIQADGMYCVECGRKLDVRKGEWVPAVPEKMKTFRGYHIPQVVLPFHAENMDNWGKIVRDVLSLPTPVVLQEILGISCSQGQRLITQAIIDKYSDLPTMYELQGQLRRYAFTVAGLDWGGAEQTSFTVLTVLGVCLDGSIEVIWARRFQGFDPDEIFQEVSKTCYFYQVKACLDPDTLVLVKPPLTSPCYKRIIDVETTDRVWDGSAWVTHNGVQLMKYVNDNELTELGNTRLTGDHRVYTGDTSSGRADSLQDRGRASAMAWRQASSPVSAWYNVRILASALGRAVTRLACAAVRKACREYKN